MSEASEYIHLPQVANLRHTRQTVCATGEFQAAPNLLAALLVLALALLSFTGAAPALAVPAADNNDVGNEFRETISTHHEIWDDLTGFGQFEYRDNPDLDYQTFNVVWPGVIYAPKRDWLQFTAGLGTLYTENEKKASTLELRPFGGVKFLLPNKFKWNIYNYTRYEFRDTQNQETYDWTSYSRVRSRFGLEIPLASIERAWKPKSWYVLADVEPVYRFDDDQIDPLYIRAGVGYILSRRASLEFIYYDEFTRQTSGSSLKQYDNIFQVNLKIDLGRGIIERLHNPSAGD